MQSDQRQSFDTFHTLSSEELSEAVACMTAACSVSRKRVARKDIDTVYWRRLELADCTISIWWKATIGSESKTGANPRIDIGEL